MFSQFLKLLSETEADLKFVRAGPLVVCGYNLKAFDLPFLEERCKQNGLLMRNGFKMLDLFVPYRKFDDVGAKHGIRGQCPLRGSNMPKLWEKGDVRTEWEFSIMKTARSPRPCAPPMLSVRPGGKP